MEKKQGWTTVGELEGCVHYKVGMFPLSCQKREFSRVKITSKHPEAAERAFKALLDIDDDKKPLLINITLILSVGHVSFEGALCDLQLILRC